MKEAVVLTLLLGISSTAANAEKCRVTTMGYKTYDVECGRNGSRVLDQAIEYNATRKSPLQMLNESRRQNANDQMLYQQHQMQQQLLQLEMQKQKQQLELEKLRKQEANNANSPSNENSQKNVSPASKYCAFVAKGARAVAGQRDKESWETMERKLLDGLREKSLPVVIKLNLIEALKTAYHSKTTPTEAFYGAEKTCLVQMAELAKRQAPASKIENVAR